MTNVEDVRVPVEAVGILEDEEAVRLERPLGDFAPGLENGPLVVQREELTAVLPASELPTSTPRQACGCAAVSPDEREQPGERKAPPPEQPIVRGPAVQGRAPQERRESSDAGHAGARTVEGPGAQRPQDRPPAEGEPGVPPANRPADRAGHKPA